jgi:hypothetical protein
LAGLFGLAALLCEGDTDPELSEIVIRPRSGWIAIDWKEIIHFRELLYYLALRDLKIRYKRTSLGVAWAVLQPLFTMIIVTIILRLLAQHHRQLAYLVLLK